MISSNFLSIILFDHLNFVKLRLILSSPVPLHWYRKVVELFSVFRRLKCSWSESVYCFGERKKAKLRGFSPLLSIWTNQLIILLHIWPTSDSFLLLTWNNLSFFLFFAVDLSLIDNNLVLNHPDLSVHWSPKLFTSKQVRKSIRFSKSPIDFFCQLPDHFFKIQRKILSSKIFKTALEILQISQFLRISPHVFDFQNSLSPTLRLCRCSIQYSFCTLSSIPHSFSPFYLFPLLSFLCYFACSLPRRPFTPYDCIAVCCAAEAFCRFFLSKISRSNDQNHVIWV